MIFTTPWNSPKISSQRYSLSFPKPLSLFSFCCSMILIRVQPHQSSILKWSCIIVFLLIKIIHLLCYNTAFTKRTIAKKKLEKLNYFHLPWICSDRRHFINFFFQPSILEKICQMSSITKCVRNN